MANAQRIIFREDGTIQILFNEKCLCGNNSIRIESERPDYATCHQCLRVLQRMTYAVPDEGIVETWGIYFDPYLANTLAGQFINQYIESLDPKRYPRDGE